MTYLWSYQQLHDLLQHPAADIRGWAATGLCTLYPRQAAAALDPLLLSGDDARIRPALAFLRRRPDVGDTERLRRLFLEGGETVSQEALEVAVTRQPSAVVPWLKEKIAAGERLGAAQVDAMISALGRVGSQDSYALLKATEQGVKQRSMAFFERYYSALLAHRKASDLDTLLGIACAEEEPEKLRIAALAVLFWQINPGLRAADVFFANSTWVNRRLGDDATRLAAIAPAGAAATIDRITEILKNLKAETAAEHGPQIAALVPTPAADSDWHALIAQQAAAFPTRPEQSQDTRYAQAVLVLAATLAGLEPNTSALEDPAGDWRATLTAVLQSRPVDVAADPGWRSLLTRVDRDQLVTALDALAGDPASPLGQMNAVMALGRLRAVSAVPVLIKAWERQPAKDLEEVLELALKSMGPGVVPALLAVLGSCRSELRPLLLSVCGVYPTPEVVQAVLEHLDECYRLNPERALRVLARIGAEAFVPFLEREVRPGERTLEAAYVRLCRLNGRESERLREAERDLKRLEKIEAAAAATSYRDLHQLPTFLTLKLICKRCDKSYQYRVGSVHLHPPAPEPLKQRYHDDLTPFRQGLVIGDSLCCKNCGARDEFSLSEESLAEVTGQAMRMVLLKRAKAKIPAGYPLQHVSYQERDGKPLSLLEIEQELLERVGAAPTQPQAHLALAKFYEYVKVPGEAKKSYLMALDLDKAALEAMAGLARLAEIETHYREAYEWCQRCLENLTTGHVYLVESFDDFKKALRDKRHEYARRAGIKPEPEPVPIRFRIEAAGYAKNRPCPCGSGKKYKLCCMGKDGRPTEVNP